MDPQEYDWSKFEIVFYYDQPIKEVFKYWATSAGLEAFFIEKATYQSPDGIQRASGEIVQKGDRYRWDWRQPLIIEGEVIDVQENKEFSFTFGSMKVSTYFATVGNQTELHLVQTDIPDSPHGLVMGHLNCRSCWVFFLTNLKSVLDMGHDLRDASPERVSALEVGFIPFSSRA